MKTFIAYGEVRILYKNEEGIVVATDIVDEPLYTLEANSLEEADEAPLEAWEHTGDSSGTIGIEILEEYQDVYDYDDILDLDEEWVLEGISDIEEEC